MALTIDDEIQFEISCAVFRAIDDTLNQYLGTSRRIWILDKHLPELIPAIERATRAALDEIPFPRECRP